MPQWPLALNITPELLRSDPQEVASWLRRMLTALAEPGGPGEDLAEPIATANATDPADDAQVEDVIRRWRNFAPTRSDELAGLVQTLRQLGYTPALSRPRGGGEPRPYLRMLAPSGENLGFLSSASFSLVEARTSPAAEDPLVQHRTGNGGPLRYPRIDLNRSEAFELVVRIAEEVASRWR